MGFHGARHGCARVGLYESQASVLASDFNRETGWKIDATRGDTLGGIVFNALGRPAEVGDAITVGSYTIKVSKVSGSEITRVTVLAPDDSDS